VILSFTVYGRAVPKGNMRPFIRKIRGMQVPIVTESSRSVKSWSQLVAQAANEAIQQLPDDDRAVMRGPVRLSIVFYMPRPKKFARPSKTDAPCITMPDWDKLARAVGDALSGVVYHDDAQIVEAIVGKFYAPLNSAPHVDIRVEPTAGVRPTAVAPAPLPLFEGLEATV